ncbi:MAG: TOBE domain-containing protein, partial [Phycisphaerae bacterium]
GSATLSASVETVEPLGEQMDVHLTLAGGQRITARVPIDMNILPGMATHVEVDMDRAHVFDATGSRVEA